MKILIIIFIIFLNSCGYKPTYSNKNTNIKINEINFNDNKINDYIFSRLNYLIKNNNSNNIFNLDINTSEENIIISKNKKGDSTRFRIKLTSKVEIKKSNEIIATKNYTNSFDYDNNSKKFELRQYEENIKIDLANQIANKIIFDLMNLK